MPLLKAFRCWRCHEVGRPNNPILLWGPKKEGLCLVCANRLGIKQEARIEERDAKTKGL